LMFKVYFGCKEEIYFPLYLIDTGQIDMDFHATDVLGRSALVWAKTIPLKNALLLAYIRRVAGKRTQRPSEVNPTWSSGEGYVSRGTEIVLFVFGFMVVTVLLNLIIAAMSSSYEASKSEASARFKAYTFDRVIELSQQPRTPAPVFAVELFMMILGWLLRKARILDFPMAGGWRNRPAFPYQIRPAEDGLPGAATTCPAMEQAREQLRGGWEQSTRAAQARVRRMRQQPDAVATRENVNSIVLAKTGPIEGTVLELTKKVAAIEAKFDAKLDTMNELLTSLHDFLLAGRDPTIVMSRARYRL